MTRHLHLIIAAALLLGASQARAQDDKPSFHLSSTLPLYVGLPLERDIYDEARHNYMLGFNWNVYFGGHIGLGVDADFLMGGEAGLKVFGAFTLMYHIFDIWEGGKTGMVDPFLGFGMGWTDAPGYYTGTGINSTYNAVVEFTPALQVGTNYWFNERIGVIVKTKIFFNRGFDFLQLTAGLNIALFDLDIFEGMPAGGL